MTKIDPETGIPLVDLVADRAKQKGTGKWTVQTALDVGAYIPTIDASLLARFASSLKDERVQLSTRLKGPEGSPEADREKLLFHLEHALYMAQLLDFAQGITLLTLGSQEHKFGLSLKEITRVWRAGSILQGKMLDNVHHVYRKNEGLGSLLLDEGVQVQLGELQESLRYIVGYATTRGIPIPALSASLGFYDSVRQGRSPANLLQAQRDYFGGHTFERTDKPGIIFHDEWENPPAPIVNAPAAAAADGGK